MCYRFYLKASDLRTAMDSLRTALDSDYATRFNIAPSTSIPAVRRSEAAGRELAMLRWGLVPHWAGSPEEMGVQLANARAETLASKPSFREAYARRRCVVPASGFFEWEKAAAGAKQPWLFQRADERPLLFAGLWEYWNSQDGTKLESCAIVTTEPNELVARLHDRMPVILSETGCDGWLGDDTGNLGALLRPFPAEAMRSMPVDPWVNSVAHDDERCIRPFQPDGPQAGEQLGLF